MSEPRTTDHADKGDGGAEAGAAEVFDAARYVVRARRVADLSQRELADALGVSRATIGRLESGAARVDAQTLSEILGLADLRLTVLDAEGREVDAVPVDVLRDHANRRFPAHLDLRAPEDQPGDRGVDPRRGLPPAKAWFRQRSSRAYDRGRRGTPVDHLTISGERRRRRTEREVRVAAAIARLAAAPEPECSCFDTCFELACAAECPCQCEPERGHTLRRTRLGDQLRD